MGVKGETPIGHIWYGTNSYPAVTEHIQYTNACVMPPKDRDTRPPMHSDSVAWIKDAIDSANDYLRESVNYLMRYHLPELEQGDWERLAGAYHFLKTLVAALEKDIPEVG